MSDLGKDVEDVFALLTRAALLLESRKFQGAFVRFPEGITNLGTLNKISYGGTIDAAELGSLLYYIADVMEGADNWKQQ